MNACDERARKGKSKIPFRFVIVPFFLLLEFVAICGVLLSDLRVTLKEGGVTYRRAAGAKSTRDL